MVNLPLMVKLPLIDGKLMVIVLIHSWSMMVDGKPVCWLTSLLIVLDYGSLTTIDG